MVKRSWALPVSGLDSLPVMFDIQVASTPRLSMLSVEPAVSLEPVLSVEPGPSVVSV